MDDWLSLLKVASQEEYMDIMQPDNHDFLHNHHHWYTTSHARPTYCNVCRDALSGVTSHGLSCEACKCKVHKRCAVKAIANCKWTTLATVGKDIIEDAEGNIIMPHQWMEGNLPVASSCAICKKTCGSVLRLQDWRCLWCRSTVHTACRPSMPVKCPLGPARVSVVPPTSVHSIGPDDAWDVSKPEGSYSPLLVFVNSKSGDNQGVKFLRRFKQLLNPAQVFDLISNGPSLGLRLFRHFDPFRILICSGDGSVGWVLSEIDKLDLPNQCQIAVLPLGTGNDLARVLGWGSSCDDDAHLPQILERYESASTKMLDRWSIMVYEKPIAMGAVKEQSVKHPGVPKSKEEALQSFEELAYLHIESIVETDDFQVVINSTKVLFGIITDLLNKCNETVTEDGQLGTKCDILRQKLDTLVETLKDETPGDAELVQSLIDIAKRNAVDKQFDSITSPQEKKDLGNDPLNTTKEMGNTGNGVLSGERRSSVRIVEKEALQGQADSLKHAIHNVMKHSEVTKKHDVIPARTYRISPSINIISPSVSTTQLTCISPLPDLRRDSIEEYFFNTLNLPVPKQFADGSSRRSSGVPECIKELEENSTVTTDKISTLEASCDGIRTDSEATIPPSEISFESDTKTFGVPLVQLATPARMQEKRMSFLDIPPTNFNDEIFSFRPIEVYERDLLRSNQAPQFAAVEHLQNKMHSTSSASNTLRNAPCSNNVYRGESITIIDTDPPERSSSDEVPGETSDVLSSIGNEECSVTSEILDKQPDTNPESESHIIVADIIQDLESDRLGHIDSPETSDTTDILHGESIMDDISSVLGQELIGAIQDNSITEDSTTLCSDKSNRRPLFKNIISSDSEDDSDCPTQFGFENIVFDIDNRCDDQKAIQPRRYCSLAQFVEGNDIARKSFKRPNRARSGSNAKALERLQKRQPEEGDADEAEIVGAPERDKPEGRHISFDESCNKESTGCTVIPLISVIVEPPSPVHGEELRTQRINEIRRHSSHAPSLTVRQCDKDRRHSGYNTDLLDTEYMRFLNCSPAATRRISSGSLFKPNDSGNLGTSKSSLLAGSTLLFGSADRDADKSKKDEKLDRYPKKLPIINPLVRLPAWPNVSSGFISKCLMANADTLCAAVSPLMDPDETLMEGFHEKCVMNNYFGIGIDAKIALDFHNKREEHPEKCRSRAKNYMWYGVLGSKQWLQKTYKNLEQRVQLECDGQRIPLPSLQGIVILNIPSFMGGTNFWGGTKEDDCFLAPSFDDRVLEVVAVFGSVQMAASRLINLQHHRIAQCQSVQINILGDEGVPVQVDGEAWIQPPGMIRIIHRGRVQMLCRNRNLEVSLKTWQEKQRQHSISIARDQQSASTSPNLLAEPLRPTTYVVGDSGVGDLLVTDREMHLLISFIEVTSSLVKMVKILIISNPTLDPNLYATAKDAGETLEEITPNGKLIDGPHLRKQLAKLIGVGRTLYENTCELLREHGNTLHLRDNGLESKMSVALADMEAGLRKCTVQKCDDDTDIAFLSALTIADEADVHKKTKPFWMRFRSTNSPTPALVSNREAVTKWDVPEVVTWLESMQLNDYVESFTKNDIRGRELLTLARRDLKDLGVTKVGHVKRILQAIKDLGGG